VPQNTQYFLRVVDCYQQLQQFDRAEKALKTRIDTYHQGNIIVELGYNFQLQKKNNKAKEYYEQAIEKIRINPNEVFAVSSAFEKKVLLEYALQCYDIATDMLSNYSFNYQKGLLYGQLGKTDLMIEMFLDEAEAHPENSIIIQNQFMRFMADDSDASFIETLRKALVIRVQKSQDLFWNHYLSWFYVQGKEFGKAFVQEKAIYKRAPESLSNIINLAQLAIQENDQETAKQVLGFVLENTKDQQLLVQAQSYLIKIKIENATQKEYPVVEGVLDALLKEYEVTPFTLSLQLIQAHFVAFNLNKPEEGRLILKKALDLRLNNYEVAQVKMELADILLYEEKFNQALIYYSQIEMDLKNDAVAHEATLKAAKTSYFKADFNWALKQFKELKSANTQLIANDALEYFLLINDNTAADSTQIALAVFAEGDYLLYQNRNAEAIVLFQSILQKFKGQEIESVTMLRLGTVYEKLGEYNLALSQYQSILDHHNDGIYSDEALFFSAEIYNNKLQAPDKAKPLYEKIIFKHEDSIYFVEARKKFRQLRGDANL
jgi:tetratricopeptide (TPR) repeat protein